VLVGPCWPPFVLTGPHSCSSLFFCWSLFVPACLSALSCVWLAPICARFCSSHRPSFVLATAHLCSSLFLCWSPLVPTHLSPIICPRSVVLTGPHAHCCSFIPFATCLCSSLFICWSPFVPACLCLLGCAGSHSVVVVPTTGCACLAFIHTCLHLFVLVYASLLCLYQI
jgi:hypothetical protein